LTGSNRVTWASRLEDIDFAIKVIPETVARLRKISPVYRNVAADSRR
jgi:hypothetical protein